MARKRNEYEPISNVIERVNSAIDKAKSDPNYTPKDVNSPESRRAIAVWADLDKQRLGLLPVKCGITTVLFERIRWKRKPIDIYLTRPDQNSPSQD